MKVLLHTELVLYTVSISQRVGRRIAHFLRHCGIICAICANFFHFKVVICFATLRDYLRNLREFFSFQSSCAFCGAAAKITQFCGNCGKQIFIFKYLHLSCSLALRSAALRSLQLSGELIHRKSLETWK